MITEISVWLIFFIFFSEEKPTIQFNLEYHLLKLIHIILSFLKSQFSRNETRSVVEAESPLADSIL